MKTLTDEEIQSAAEQLVAVARAPPGALGSAHRGHARAHGRHAAHHQRRERAHRPAGRGLEGVHALQADEPAGVRRRSTTCSRAARRFPATISPGRLIEPEIMFRVDRDLPARDGALRGRRARRRGDGRGRIRDHRVAVQSGRRLPLDGQGSLYGALSDHIANGCIVVGDAIPAGAMLRSRTCTSPSTKVTAKSSSVVGCHPFDNPFFPVVVGLNRLRRHQGARAGDIIVTNSSTSFFPVDAGTVVRAGLRGAR